MKQSKNEINLGEGSVGRLLLTLAVPSVIAQLVNLLYNLVDRIYIGHIPENGGVALTGLGLCFPILMIVTAFSGLIGYGGAPRVAIFMGKGKNDEAEEILGNCTMALIVIALILVAVCTFLSEHLRKRDFVCHAYDGIKFLYQYTGIFQSRYENSSDRGSLQYYFRSGLYFRI